MPPLHVLRLLLLSVPLASLLGCCGAPVGIDPAAVAPVTTWQAASPPPWRAEPFRILVQNVKLLPVVDADDEAARTAAISRALAPRLATADVVILNEAFDDEHTARLLRGLADRGLVHVTAPLDESWFGFEGGVRIASRWPIQREARRVFCCGVLPDAFADKGVVYACLQTPAGPVNLFATHLQSTFLFRVEKARAVQRSQLAQIRAYVDELALPADEPVLFAGDFNLDLRTPRDLGLLLTSLDAEPPPLDLTQPYTYDGERNALARAGIQRWIDYVLTSRRHARPVWSSLRALPLRDPIAGDLSDHYPIEASYVFAPLEQRHLRASRPSLE